MFIPAQNELLGPERVAQSCVTDPWENANQEQTR